MNKKNKLKSCLSKIHQLKPKTKKKALIISLIIAVVAGSVAAIIGWQRIPSPPPQNVQITNQLEKSLSVSWTTPKNKRNCVIFTDKQPGILQKLILSFNRFVPDVLSTNKVCDDHKQAQTNHHVTLIKLKPDTEYFYQIASGAKTYDIHLFTLQTRLYTEKKQTVEPLPSIKTIEKRKHKSSSPVPLYGNVFNRNGSPAVYQTIYLKTSGAANQLSAVTDRVGSYYFDLTNLYTDKLELIDITSNRRLVLTVKEKSIVTTINRATPAPDLIIND